jgi:MYXO-CTERM domain-containing protein
MRKMVIFMALALVLSGAISAQAAPTIDDPGNGETHLYQIFANSLFNGGNYASSQDIANNVPIVETFASGLPFKVTAYATFAGFTQNPGAYFSGSPGPTQYFSPGLTSAFPTLGSQNSIVAINDWPAGQFTGGVIGLFDDTSGGGIYFTELAANNGGALGQSNGLIFKISNTHYIVAFEDGGGINSLGDKDYNDLVLNVTTSAAPLPPSAFLLGSGLLGLIGWRRRK